MTAAQTKAAGRRIKQRYRGGKSSNTIQASIEREREKAARQTQASKKK